jgi:uncharacterized protein (TIGR02466 family)
MARESERWIESSTVIPMFPTLVWKIQLEPRLRDEIEAAIVPALEEMRRALPKLEPGCGWQSERELHTRQEFQKLFACVMSGAKGVLRFLRIGYDALEITGCWASVLARGARHNYHSHPNNFLSAVYYVRTHPGAECINFHDPRSQASVIRPPVTELTAENTDQVVVPVRNGTLLMFPAYLPHSVDETASDEERISVSFNLMFSAFTENLAKPLW